MIGRASYVMCDDCGHAGPVDCFDGAVGARALGRTVEGIERVKIDGVEKDLCPRCRRRRGEEDPA